MGKSNFADNFFYHILTKQNNLPVTQSEAICQLRFDGSVGEPSLISKQPNDDDRALQWRHNGRDSVLNLQPHDCLLNRLFRRRSKKTSKLHVTGLCAGNSPLTGGFPAQMASNAENVSIWWRHQGKRLNGAVGLILKTIWAIIDNGNASTPAWITDILLRIFEINFPERKYLYHDSNFTEVCWIAVVSMIDYSTNSLLD